MLVCFDTETTGLGANAQLVQFSAVDENGEELANFFIKPDVSKYNSKIRKAYKLYNFLYRFVNIMPRGIAKKVSDKTWRLRKTAYGKFMYSWNEASKVNGITPLKTMFCLDFEHYRDYIQELFNQAEEIMGYNSQRFDVRVLQNMGITIPEVNHRDIMKEYAPYSGQKFKNGNPKPCKLTVAAGNIGYQFKAHDSLNDCRATLAVSQWIDRENQFM